MSCKLLIATFIITGIYDAILNLSIHDKIPLPQVTKTSDWYVALKDNKYFEKHTPLAAFLIAGFVGFLAQAVIILIYPFPSVFTIENIGQFLFITFVISGAIGFPMQVSGLFPILEDAYYKPLRNVSTYRSFVTDGMSGLVVQGTLLLLTYFKPYLLKK